MQKRKTQSRTESAKRSRINKYGHFRVGDLKNELPFSPAECINWFNTYTGPGKLPLSQSSNSSAREPVIGPAGIERLCQDISVDPEDTVMLALAWKLNAGQLGFFKQSEWVHGMADLECDDCEKLKRKLPRLRELFINETHFKSIYQFCFDFTKGAGHRNLEIELGKAMLKLIFGTRWALLSEFIAFLDNSRYKVLNRDQWNNILEFSKTIKPDLSNYDVNGAWPVMLDEFVEFYQKSCMETQPDD